MEEQPALDKSLHLMYGSDLVQHTPASQPIKKTTTTFHATLTVAHVADEVLGDSGSCPGPHRWELSVEMQAQSSELPRALSKEPCFTPSQPAFHIMVTIRQHSWDEIYTSAVAPSLMYQHCRSKAPSPSRAIAER